MEAFCVWFTGLPGSGKTTLSVILANELRSRGLRVARLDGDVVRQGLSRDLGFSRADRRTNIERVVFVARLLVRSGVVALCSFVSPYRDVREFARGAIGRFVEVYCKCSLDVLLQQDARGLYRKALAGEIEQFTGVSDPYEEPLGPELVVQTDKETVVESVGKIVAYLELGEYIRPEAKRSLFIGRWQPLHAGHVALIYSALAAGREVIIGVRDTPVSADNPLSVEQRVALIRSAFGPGVKVVVIPDFDEICFGRRVGYGFREIRLGLEEEGISGTRIREGGCETSFATPEESEGGVL